MIRPAQPHDIPTLIDLFTGAFRVEAGSPRGDRLRAQLAHTLSQWLVYEHHGAVLGMAHAHRSPLRMGAATLALAHLSEVAVHPDAQGGGHGTRLMHEAVDHLAARGDHLARLGGLFRFYARFGFQRFSRRYVEFTVGRLAGVGADQVLEGEVELSEEEAGRLAAAHADRLDEEQADLLDRVHDHEIGYEPVARDRPFHEPALVLEYRDGGRLLGVACGFEREGESEFEAKLTIERVGYEPACPAALRTMTAWLVNRVARQGQHRLTMRLPFDPRVLESLSRLPARFRLCETFGGLGGNMLRVLDPRATWRAMEAEWNLRLRRAGVRGGGRTWEWIVHEQPIRWTVAGDAVASTDAAADVRVDVPAPHFLRLLLGLSSYAQIRPALALPDGLTEFDDRLFAAMFPAGLSASGGWG